MNKEQFSEALDDIGMAYQVAQQYIEELEQQMKETELDLQAEDRMREVFNEKSHQSVYVLTANENHRIKECIVVSDYTIAHTIFHILSDIYGGANVGLFSRAVNKVPENIQHAKRGARYRNKE